MDRLTSTFKTFPRCQPQKSTFLIFDDKKAVEYFVFVNHCCRYLSKRNKRRGEKHIDSKLFTPRTSCSFSSCCKIGILTNIYNHSLNYHFVDFLLPLELFSFHLLYKRTKNSAEFLFQFVATSRTIRQHEV